MLAFDYFRSSLMDITLYEQPVNEQIRVCLRLEQLFFQAQQTLANPAAWASRASLATLIELINVLDRPDLKTKLVKELARHLASLSRLEQTPQIDQHKLSTILVELEDLIDHLHATTGKIGQELRDNEFINSLRQHLAVPGGGCNFDLPIYHYWLQLPSNTRLSQLNSWFHHFDVIQATVKLLLRLVRQSSVAQAKIANQGFYQNSLDPHVPCQLIQVAIPTQRHIFPEISVGRHGLFIRFFEPNIGERPQQTHQDIEFQLTICAL